MDNNILVDNARDSFDLVAFRLVRGATRWLPPDIPFWLRSVLVVAAFLLLTGAGIAVAGENSGHSGCWRSLARPQPWPS